MVDINKLALESVNQENIVKGYLGPPMGTLDENCAKMTEEEVSRQKEIMERRHLEWKKRDIGREIGDYAKELLKYNSTLTVEAALENAETLITAIYEKGYKI